jgi:hypothetical protein
MKFAEFEEKVKEVERARAIYRYALDHIPKGQVRCGRRARSLVTVQPGQVATVPPPVLAAEGRRDARSPVKIACTCP